MLQKISVQQQKLFKQLSFNRYNTVNKKQEFYLILGISLVAVFLLFHFHYNLKLLNPNNTYWLMGWDWGTHYMGWNFFRHEPWGFPLCAINNYFAPLGTNLAFTDSIPLMALLIKPFSALLPLEFQYIGPWFFICFVLQALFATLIVKEFRTGWLPSLFMVLFLTISPIILARHPHPALNSHWIILASIWIFILPMYTQNVKRLLVYQFTVLLLSIYIHPYLTTLTIIFSLLLVFKAFYIKKSIHISTWIVLSTLIPIITLLNMYIIGYIGTSDDIGLSLGGFGEYSLNLNGLFNPTIEIAASSFFAGFPTLSSKQSFEGFNYMGAGMILLLLVAIVVFILQYKQTFKTKFSQFFSYKKAWFYLLLVALFLFLYSLSNVISLNDRVLFSYPLPPLYDKLCNSFRSSGRFFWPVYYLIFLFIFFVLVRGLKKAWLIAAFIIPAFVLQMFDIKPIMNFWVVETMPYQPKISVKNWSHLFANFETISFYPPFGRSYNSEDDYLDFCYLAAPLNKKINIGYVNRTDDYKRIYNINKLKNKLKNNLIPQEELIITTPRYFSMLKPLCDAGHLKYTFLDGYYALFSSKNKIIPLHGFNHSIIIVPTITEYIKQNEENIIIFSIRDEGRKRLPPDFIAYLKEKKSAITNLAYRGSYVLIIANKKIIFEKIDNNNQILFQKSTGDIVNNLKIVKPLKIVSAGIAFGDKSIISIADVDYSLNMRGINMVVLDNNFTFIKKSNADTFEGPYITKEY